MSVSGRGLEWTPELEDKLRELAKQRFTGYEIASQLSAELGVPISADSVYVKASRLGISLMGRASSLESYEITKEDPFGPPSWVRRDLKNLSEVSRFPQPRIIVTIGLDAQKPTDEEISEKIKNEYCKKWSEYVSHVVASGAASQEQAQRALGHPIPRWFKQWCGEPAVVIMWDPDLDPARVEAYAKKGASVESIKESLEIESLLEENADLLSHTATIPNAQSQNGRRKADITPGDRVWDAPRSRARSSPFEKCARCDGKPIYDHTLGEWVCESCGHILRFKP